MSSYKGFGLAALGMSALSAIVAVPLVLAVAVSGASTTLCSTASSVELSELAGESAQDYLADFSEKEKADKFALIKEVYKAGAERPTPASTHAITLVIAVGIQESNLDNLSGGDRDSAGFLQQRPSQNWGTYEQVRDPYYATNKFLDRYDSVKDAETRPLIDVAIEIQNPSISAYYSRWKWDRTAAELYEMAIGQNGNSSCEQSTEWQNPVDSYSISSTFGMRQLSYEPRPRMHNGVDMASKDNTPIHAAHAGVIGFMGYKGNYGNLIQILHDDDITTGYGHMNSFSSGLKEGDRVNAGDVIGYMGSTGGSTGTHLHYEISVGGKFVDPIPFMNNVGIDLRKPPKG
jgi:murein DD-endopeptidase MepM/ murein hydrolase activator NlpD